jgi:hypothetical protein
VTADPDVKYSPHTEENLSACSGVVYGPTEIALTRAMVPRRDLIAARVPNGEFSQQAQIRKNERAFAPIGRDTRNILCRLTFLTS